MKFLIAISALIVAVAAEGWEHGAKYHGSIHIPVIGSLGVPIEPLANQAVRAAIHANVARYGHGHGVWNEGVTGTWNGAGAHGAWGAGNGAWGAGNGAWGGGNGAWGAGNGAWGAGNGASGTGNGASGAGSGSWGSGNGAWGAGHAESGAGSGAWGAGNGASGSGNGAWGVGNGARNGGHGNYEQYLAYAADGDDGSYNHGH